MSEGAPHDADGNFIYRWGTGGVGRAMCACGALSPEMNSATKRKQWHREHKADVARATESEEKP